MKISRFFLILFCIVISIGSFYISLAVKNHVELDDISFTKAHKIIILSHMAFDETLLEKAAVIYSDKIQPDTQIIFRTYKDGESQDETIQSPPYYLIGLSRTQLEAYYQDWHVVAFSEKKVILQKEDTNEMDELYILGAYEGYLAVYFDNQLNQTGLKEITDIPLSILSKDEQELIVQGIPVQGEQDLFRLLEDYGS